MWKFETAFSGKIYLKSGPFLKALTKMETLCCMTDNLWNEKFSLTPTKRTQHCCELAQKRRKPADSLYNTITDNAFINDNCYFTDDAIEDESSEFEV